MCAMRGSFRRGVDTLQENCLALKPTDAAANCEQASRAPVLFERPWSNLLLPNRRV